MDTGTRALIEHSLASRSVDATVELFSGSICATISHSQVREIKRQMDGAAKQATRAKNGPAVQDSRGEVFARRAAEHGCSQLLAAMLRAGQHYHTLSDARAIGVRLGLKPSEVRPGIGAAAGDRL